MYPFKENYNPLIYYNQLSKANTFKDKCSTMIHPRDGDIGHVFTWEAEDRLLDSRGRQSANEYRRLESTWKLFRDIGIHIFPLISALSWECSNLYTRPIPADKPPAALYIISLNSKILISNMAYVPEDTVLVTWPAPLKNN